MFQTITKLINDLDINTISADRKKVLSALTHYIKSKIGSGEQIRLNFICTHNSRRSHLSQIWAQAMAAYYGIPNVFCYSGGTEATAMFPKVGETLTNQGFRVDKLSEGDNPIYAIAYAENDHPVIAFSKTYDAAFNPASGFAAIMTCSSADAGCPMVLGCDARIAMTFEDPKLSDGTPQQTETYLERSLQIATELKFVFAGLS